MSSRSKTDLDPEFAAKLVKLEAVLAKQGIKLLLTSGYRSYGEQDQLYAIGRTKPGKRVTNARGGYSWHNFRLAADYAFVINGKVTWDGPWDILGRTARSLGLEWGGDWRSLPDRPHIQMTKGRTLAQMRAFAAAKKAGG